MTPPAKPLAPSTLKAVKYEETFDLLAKNIKRPAPEESSESAGAGSTTSLSTDDLADNLHEGSLARLYAVDIALTCAQVYAVT